MRDVRIRIRRFDGKISYWSEYVVRIGRSTTVLDALLRIKEEQDPTLAFRYNCRMGRCGACGMVINGRPRLACETRIETIGGDVVVVEPLDNLPVVKDLVVDHDEFFNKHRSAMPWIIREDFEITMDLIGKGGEYLESGQTPQELDRYAKFAECIYCGICYSSCPVVAENPKFMGPQAFVAVFRWNNDSRDKGSHIRLKIVDAEHGVWSCKNCTQCNRVCPKGIKPLAAIQLLRYSIKNLLSKELP